MINLRLAYARACPTTPSFQRFLISRHLSLVILVFFLLKVTIVLIQGLIAFKDSLMEFNSLSQVKICSLRLILLFEFADINTLGQVLIGH